MNREGRKLFQTTEGPQKLDEYLAGPINRELEKVNVWRQVSIVEPVDPLAIAYFDSDKRKIYGAKITKKRDSLLIDGDGRVTIDEFLIESKEVAIPISELDVENSDTLKKAKEKLRVSIAVKEDSYGFSLLEAITDKRVIKIDNGDLGTPTKTELKKIFDDAEDSGNKIRNVVMSPYGPTGIRRWEFKDLDEATRAAILKTGYMGSLWDADFYCSDLLPAKTWYFLVDPMMCSWMPIYNDVAIEVVDITNDDLLIVKAVEYVGMVIHDASSITKIEML